LMLSESIQTKEQDYNQTNLNDHLHIYCTAPLLSSPVGNVQGHMAVSPRMGKWRYIWHKQLKKRG